MQSRPNRLEFTLEAFLQLRQLPTKPNGFKGLVWNGGGRLLARHGTEPLEIHVGIGGVDELRQRDLLLGFPRRGIRVMMEAGGLLDDLG